MEYILAMGNYINSGTKKGGAYGFKLSSLTKVTINDFNLYSVSLSLLPLAGRV